MVRKFYVLIMSMLILAAAAPAALAETTLPGGATQDIGIAPLAGARDGMTSTPMWMGVPSILTENTRE
ncbi:hypothetical protein [Methanogenium cariaci]|uniref:hypothetical protein n=1 Tax=Methanogenium cariaci TaxID=2197 RepID=UPI0012F68C0C|nr:hypothetical protein [Methanogenium cariaci]